MKNYLVLDMLMRDYVNWINEGGKRHPKCRSRFFLSLGSKLHSLFSCDWMQYVQLLHTPALCSTVMINFGPK